MEDILIQDKNSHEFKISIYKMLNSNLNNINEELLDIYINNVLTNELNNIDEDLILLHPIIIKLSKDKELYDKYGFKITKLKYNEYIDKVKKIIEFKKKLNIIKRYALTNIDILDYQNNIELEIASIYANLILKDYLKDSKQLKWFIIYIIKKEAVKHQINPNIEFIDIKYLKDIKLYKINNYIKYKDYNENKYNNTIYINIGLYKIIKKEKGNKASLVYLLNTCFKELQRYIMHYKEQMPTYDDNIYRFIKEGIIFKEDNNFYNQNKLYFSSEISINEEKNNMTKTLIDNPLFSNFDFINEDNEDNNYSNYKNTKDFFEVDNHIDNILVNNPKILDKYPLLKMEYNENGIRKNIKELIEIKRSQKDFFEKQIVDYKNIIKDSDNEIVINSINNKLNDILNGINGVIRCHNIMIYKALRVLNIPNFTKLLNNISKEDIVEIMEVIDQEKEDIIKKLENNRKKIFKTATFLKNDEFLTKEYSKVAGYESKINDFEKEKSTN